MKLGLKRDEVKVEPYNPGWAAEFLIVKQAILKETPIAENQIEHIGSTAIKGIFAKPILDIVIGVHDVINIQKEVFQGLKKVGFLRLKVDRPNEIVLAKFTDETYEEKTHFVHLVEYKGELWQNLLFFRDYLNANEAAKMQYENLKLEFLKQPNGNIVAYTVYKEQFVKEIYAKRESV